jgi:hypothetical protein
MSLNERCRQDGCERLRGRYSIFCDEHHRVQLIRVGLERETAADPCAGMPEWCQRILRACELHAITDDEAFSNLFDRFIHAGMHGLERCWGPCLDAMSPDAVAGLLAYAKAHSEPRLFRTAPDAARRTEQRALEVQDRLLRRLSNWLPAGEKRGAAGADWYREHRREVEVFFTDDHLIAGSEQVHTSPTGKYRLVVTRFKTKDGCWNYTRGMAYAGERIVADVQRNYSNFFFCWAERHPDGHDYLLCGEDYQGQTVVQLDTGRRADYAPDQAKSGHGFCCAAYYPSPDRKLVVVEGCYWACPYELVFCRFDDPMSLPWPQIERADLSGEVRGWSDEGFAYESAEDVRVGDGKAYAELSEDEQDELMARWQEVGGQRIRGWLRRSDGTKVALDERVVPNTPQPGADGPG